MMRHREGQSGIHRVFEKTFVVHIIEVKRQLLLVDEWSMLYVDAVAQGLNLLSKALSPEACGGCLFLSVLLGLRLFGPLVQVQVDMQGWRFHILRAIFVQLLAHQSLLRLTKIA